jgi:hypothetical protein
VPGLPREETKGSEAVLGSVDLQTGTATIDNTQDEMKFPAYGRPTKDKDDSIDRILKDETHTENHRKNRPKTTHSS